MQVLSCDKNLMTEIVRVFRYEYLNADCAGELFRPESPDLIYKLLQITDQMSSELKSAAQMEKVIQNFVVQISDKDLPYIQISFTLLEEITT